MFGHNVIVCLHATNGVLGFVKKFPNFVTTVVIVFSFVIVTHNFWTIYIFKQTAGFLTSRIRKTIASKNSNTAPIENSRPPSGKSKTKPPSPSAERTPEIDKLPQATQPTQ